MSAPPGNARQGFGLLHIEIFARPPGRRRPAWFVEHLEKVTRCTSETFAISARTGRM
jgi:hypothetical protein